MGQKKTMVNFKKMSEKNKSAEVAVVENANVVTDVAMIHGLDLDLSAAFQNKASFEEDTVNFLNFTENQLEGVEMQFILKRKVKMDLKDSISGEMKSQELVEGYYCMEKDGKPHWIKTYLGQAQIKSAFDRFNIGNGVAAYITFKGLIKVPKQPLKSMNDYLVLAKSL